MRLHDLLGEALATESKAQQIIQNKKAADLWNSRASFDYNDKQHLEQWIEYQKKIKVIDSGKVNGDLSIDLVFHKGSVIPNHEHWWARNDQNQEIFAVKLNEVTGNLYCSQRFLETLENFPNVVHGDLHIINNRLKTCEGGPIEVDGDYNVTNNRLRGTTGFAKKIGKRLMFGENDTIHDLKGIHKDVKSVGEYINIPCTVTESILGLNAIAHSAKVVIAVRSAKGPAKGAHLPYLKKALGILWDNREDIMECQEELIQAGLKQYARM